MEIVKFKDGRYGIRKGNFITGYKFISLNTFLEWKGRKEIEKYCKGTFEEAKEAHSKLTDNGKPIYEGLYK